MNSDTTDTRTGMGSTGAGTAPGSGSMGSSSSSGTMGTSDTMASSGSTGGSSSMGGGMESMGRGPNVQRVAQRAHEAVDRLEQTFSSGTDRVMGWQEEYGERAREQIRANPIAVVAGAFALGYLIARVTR